MRILLYALVVVYFGFLPKQVLSKVEKFWNIKCAVDDFEVFNEI